MALYLGNSERLKINIGGVLYSVQMMPNVSGVMITSFDGYILKDVNGLYVTTTKEGDK